MEVKKIWNCREVVAIPIIVGTLGTVSKSFNKFMGKLNIKVNFQTLQKSCSLGMATIIRKLLDS